MIYKTNKTNARKPLAKIFKMTTSLVLALLMCLPIAMPVFADITVGPGVITAVDEDHPAQAAITKILKMPIGTPTPNATFTFTFTKVSYDQNIDPIEDIAKMPSIGTTVTADTTKSTVTLPFTSEDKATAAGVIVNTNNGTKQVIKETDNVLANVPWPTAGVFEYNVEEEVSGFTKTDHEEITYSKAKYNIKVFVENKTDKSGLYVKYIAANIIYVDIPVPETSGSGKVDPTPGGPSQLPGGYSQMIFTNYYLKNNGTTTPPTNPDNAVMQIKKTVANIGADHALYFKFEATVNNPETVYTDETYKAYFYQYNTTSNAYELVTTIPSTSPHKSIAKQDGNGYYYIDFSIKNKSMTSLVSTDSVSKTFYLMHDQILAFINTPVGTPFKVTEFGYKDYTTGCELAAFSSKPDTLKYVTANYVNTTAGTALTVPKGDSSDAFTTLAYIADTSNANKAFFTNTFKTITPTGISVDDLPYIVLFTVVLTALTGYIVFKVRKSAKSKA